MQKNMRVNRINQRCLDIEQNQIDGNPNPKEARATYYYDYYNFYSIYTINKHNHDTHHIS